MVPDYNIRSHGKCATCDTGGTYTTLTHTCSNATHDPHCKCEKWFVIADNTQEIKPLTKDKEKPYYKRFKRKNKYL